MLDEIERIIDEYACCLFISREGRLQLYFNVYIFEIVYRASTFRKQGEDDRARLLFVLLELLQRPALE
jgi:hypothetical protein